MATKIFIKNPPTGVLRQFLVEAGFEIEHFSNTTRLTLPEGWIFKEATGINYVAADLAGNLRIEAIKSTEEEGEGEAEVFYLLEPKKAFTLLPTGCSCGAGTILRTGKAIYVGEDMLGWLNTNYPSWHNPAKYW